MTLETLLSLVCDPVTGLVEVTCIKRNSIVFVVAKNN
ncbi:L-serine ammonia-lyase, iron-sulfur-dependent, subunit alpha [Bacillus sp. FJAT-27231]